MRNARWIVLAVLACGCASSRSTENRAVLHSGYQALSQHDYNGAMARADQFLRENPTGGPGTAEALYLQGRVYEQRAEASDSAGKQNDARRDLQAARGTYEHALTLNPSPTVAALIHAGIANTAYFAEDYFTAMREWAAAYPGLQQADAKAWVLYRIGLSQQRLGRFEEADRNFALVRQQYPNTEAAHRAVAHEGARAFFVQVGVYSDAANANKTVASLRSQGFAANQSSEGSGRQAIRVGPTHTYEQAKALRQRLLNGFPGAVIEP